MQKFLAPFVSILFEKARRSPLIYWLAAQSILRFNINMEKTVVLSHLRISLSYEGDFA